MGLPGVDGLQLPDRLPDLPAAIPPLPDVEQQAMASRIDLQMTRLQAEALAKNLGLTRSTRFINVLELGIINNVRTRSHNSAATRSASSCRCSTGGRPAWCRPNRAIARRWSVHAKPRSTRARKCVKPTPCSKASTPSRGICATKWCRSSSAFPRKTSCRYNGMLIGVFELLADARAQIASVNAAIEAQRDFWLADADCRWRWWARLAKR